MGQPAAKMGDKVVAVDTHIYLIPAPPGPPVPTPLPSPFNGIISQNVSTDVMIMGQPAATVGSIAMNTPPHLPEGGPFMIPPTNQGQIILGSMTVLINGKPAARLNDKAMTCNDPAPLPVGTVIAVSTVMIGG